MQNFCILTLYLPTLMNSLMRSSGFLVASLVTVYFFFSNLNSIYYFSSLITVARTSKTVLNNGGKSEHSYCVPGLRRNAFNFSPLRMLLAVGLSYTEYIYGLYYVEVASFRAYVLESFFSPHKLMLNFIKSFFCIY